MEQWAEVRRLHRSEGVPIKEIARRLGIARNTVRAALKADEPPKYSRPARGSAVDEFEPHIRALLTEYPTMPATVIAQRIGWTHSLTVLKDRVRVIRPEYRGVDPVDRVVYSPGGVSQWDLWFPDYQIPLGDNTFGVFPVLVMTLAYSRFMAAIMLPTRQGGDLTAGMWQLTSRVGGVTKTLVWDREAAIGGKGKPTALAAAYCGTLGTSLRLAPPADPEFKGMVERNNRFFETSFLPGRTFTSPADFTNQFDWWATNVANTRTVRSIGGRPIDLLDADRAAMTALPPVAPHTGLHKRIQLPRDYYVRVAGNDYSVHPSVIGHHVEVVATIDRVRVMWNQVCVADHDRFWGTGRTVTDPQHVQAAKELRATYWHQVMRTRSTNLANQRARVRAHADGHEVPIRSLPDYDTLYNVSFTTTTAATATTAAAGGVDETDAATGSGDPR